MLTDYNVSTITAIGNIYQERDPIEIDRLFDVLPLGKIDELTSIQSVQYGLKLRSLCELIKDPKKAFGNQITLVFVGNNASMKINTKLFKNGNIQMTGIKDMHLGRSVLMHLCTTLNSLLDTIAFKLTHLDICLINSNSDIGYRVKRDLLFNSISEHQPCLQCSYEPCIYPGVMIKIMYNSDTKSTQGTCICDPTTQCTGKSNGLSRFNCRKVSIAVFQSGKVIVTGAHSYEQLDHAYSFLKTFIELHGKEFRMPEQTLPITNAG
jgi:TATA-box binding protein (TBP) (component of TFIID and TFIIIB)